MNRLPTLFPWWLVFVFIGLVVLATIIGMAQTIVTVDMPRSAVDLALVVERNDAGDVTKIHRFILWSNGDVTFPNLPYYAALRLSCRDCPKQENPCPGDIDGDGVVGVPDLLIVQGSWGNCTE